MSKTVSIKILLDLQTFDDDEYPMTLDYFAYKLQEIFDVNSLQDVRNSDETYLIVSKKKETPK